MLNSQEDEPVVMSLRDFLLGEILTEPEAPSTVQRAAYRHILAEVSDLSTVVLKSTPISEYSENEVAILRKLRHPHIVPLLSSFDEPNSDLRILVFPSYREDLYKYGQENVISPQNIQKWAHHMCLGIKYLHDSKILHRDIKPENMFITDTDMLVIGDFSHAVELPPKKPLKPKETTLNYSPIEIVLGATDYSFPLDIWSAGATWIFMYRRCHMSVGHNDIGQLDQIFQVFGSVDNNEWPEFEEICIPLNVKFASNIPQQFSRNIPGAGRAAQDLILKMMNYNPKKRLTIDEVLADSYWTQENHVLTRGASLRPPFPHPVGGPADLVTSEAEPRVVRAAMRGRGYFLVDGVISERP